MAGGTFHLLVTSVKIRGNSVKPMKLSYYDMDMRSKSGPQCAHTRRRNSASFPSLRESVQESLQGLFEIFFIKLFFFNWRISSQPGSHPRNICCFQLKYFDFCQEPENVGYWKLTFSVFRWKQNICYDFWNKTKKKKNLPEKVKLSLKAVLNIIYMQWGP